MTEIVTPVGLSNGYTELMPNGGICTKCGHTEEAHYISVKQADIVYDHGHCQICTCPVWNGGE